MSNRELPDHTGAPTPLLIADWLVRQRRRLVLGTVAGTVLGLGLAIFSGAEYRAQSSFIPQTGEETSSRIAGVAAQFGFSLPTSGGPSIELFGRLLKSRELLTQVIVTRYSFTVEEGDTLDGDLIEIYRIEGDTPIERMNAALERMVQDVVVSVDLDASLVALQTIAPYQPLSEALNRRLLDLLDRFNRESRASQASAERQFIEGRLEEARAELGAAEARLAAFLEANRTYQSSPQLSFQAATLQRQVDLRQQVYGTLAQGYEQARMDEVRNTPVITVVDRPEGSARRVGSPVWSAIFGGLMGFGLTLAALLLALYARNLAEASPENRAALARVTESFKPSALFRRRRP